MYRILVVYSVVILAIFTQIEESRQTLPCPGLKLKFGRIRYRQKGRFVKFQCNTGYITAGEKYSICIRGEWDSPPPRCVRTTCPMVRPPINGLIYPSHRGAVLNFFCKPDYVLRGSNITYCDGRQWSDNLPSCVKSNTKPALSCDFESDDLCGWTHDLRHDFDWVRMNFSTPSGYLGTGPAYDHTKGEQGNGYYMYIESSSRTENEAARLISPIYDKVDTNLCFKFFYHMYGSSIGTLRIYLKKISASWDLEPSHTIFNKTGNQGNYWLEGFVKLGPIDEDFQIVIEGINGPSYVGDIAIDDVQLIENCTDDDEIISTTTLYETAPVFSTGTCANRCFNDTTEISEDTFQISCDCVENCMERNTCCPDFIALCVADSTDDSPVSYIPTFSLTSTSKAPKVTVNQNKNETNVETPTTVANNKTGKVEIGTDVNINSVFPKNVNKTNSKSPGINEKTTDSPNLFTTIPFTTKIQSTATSKSISSQPPSSSATMKSTQLTTIATPVTKKPVVILPTLKFLTPLPTQPIIRILPKTGKTKVMSTKAPITVAILKTTTSTTTTKLSTEQTKTNDIVTIATKKAVTFTLKEDEKEPDNGNNKETDEVFSGENTKIAMIVHENSKPTPTKFAMPLILSITIIIVIVIVCVALYVRRYSVRGCRKMSRFKSSGDSQSDVRFLTSDEQLDFTLATSDSYNTL